MKHIKSKHYIYLDYAAATPLSYRVKKAMEPYWIEHYGNAGSIHKEGIVTKKVIDDSRVNVANALSSHKDEIVFTGSGTESNNLAIFGITRHFLNKHNVSYQDLHFITSVIEHPSVLNCFKELEKRGASVTYIPVDKDGRFNPKEITGALQENTVLISCAYVNGEIGTIEPIDELSRVLKAHKKNKKSNSEYPYLHTDASQAFLYLDIDMRTLHADLCTFDAQKIYGPKGIGLLYTRRGVNIDPILEGGGQERGLRPGTENLPLIVGFAKAVECALRDRHKERERVTRLRDLFIKGIQEKIPNMVINGSMEHRIANNVNVSLPGFDNEYLTLLLDASGILCGTKSACQGGGEDISYVVAALEEGVEERARSSVRFSLGKYTTKIDIEYTIIKLLHIAKNFDNTNKS